jgi:hypothetical protein
MRAPLAPIGQPIAIATRDRRAIPDRTHVSLTDPSD